MNNFPPKNYADLSRMLIWHRKRSKISQQMLADLAGVSRTAVQRLECGVTPVQIDTLLKILNILNIEMSYTSPLMESYIETIAKHSNESESSWTKVTFNNCSFITQVLFAECFVLMALFMHFNIYRIIKVRPFHWRCRPAIKFKSRHKIQQQCWKGY